MTFPVKWKALLTYGEDGFTVLLKAESVINYYPKISVWNDLFCWLVVDRVGMLESPFVEVNNQLLCFGGIEMMAVLPAPLCIDVHLSLLLHQWLGAVHDHSVIGIFNIHYTSVSALAVICMQCVQTQWHYKPYCLGWTLTQTLCVSLSEMRGFRGSGVGLHPFGAVFFTLGGIAQC